MLYRSFVVLGLVVALGITREARAQVTDQLMGARTLGMGGVQRGLGTSNETIYWNPAGMALRKRYEAEVQYARANVDKLNALNISIVDSNTSAIAGGVGYTYTWGGPREAGLHRLRSAFALAVSDALVLGIGGEHLFGHYTPLGDDDDDDDDLSLWTADAGLLARFSEHLRVGASARNLLRDERSQFVRRDLGVGAAYVDETFTLAGDAIWDLEDKTRATAYKIGAEYIAGGSFPLRVGYAHRPYRGDDGEDHDENVLTGGAGAVVSSGALHLGYERSLSRDNVWRLGVAVTISF